MSLRAALSSVLSMLLLSSSTLNACTACFGKTDEALAQGMNAGIYVMLVFVAAAWVFFWQLLCVHCPSVQACELRSRNG